ncbi:MAG: hypothetical protein AAF630_13900 [Cyanobacteria bacterium P01_C01_bin.38]
MTFSNKPQGHFQNFKWDKTEKFLLNGFGVLIFIFVIGFGVVNARRNFLPYKITLAAGKRTGASYIISDALAKVAKKHTNIKEVIELMKLNNQNQISNPTVDRRIESLKDLFGRQEKLNQKF